MPKRTYRRAHASARFHGPDLDPLLITRALELPPDHQHRAGEPRLWRTRKGVVRRAADHRGGLWSMSSQSWIESPRLEVHLDWLLAQLEPRRDTIRGLLDSGIRADFFCFSSGTTDTPPSLPTSIREQAGSLGFRIEIDHYHES